MVPDILIHTYGLDHFRGLKNDYFLEYEEIVDILGGQYIIGLIWGIVSLHFRDFSLGIVQNGNI